ncbi:MAG: hypothetical protein WKH64_10770 [Chloroflexia bacterium]
MGKPYALCENRYDYILLDDGKTFTRYVPGSHSKDFTTDESEVPMALGLMVPYGHVPTEQGRSQVAGITPPKGWIAIVRNPPYHIGGEVTFVDEKTGLPQRIGNTTSPYEGSRVLFDYRALETIERGSLPENHFRVESLPPLPGEPDVSAGTTGPIPTPGPYPYPTAVGAHLTPTPPPATVPDVSPLLVGDGVLHIELSRTMRSPKGVELQLLNVEFWYDRSTGEARSQSKTVAGAPNGDRILLSDGKTSVNYGGSGAAETIPPDGSRISPPVDAMFPHKHQMLQYILQPAYGAAPRKDWMALRHTSPNYAKEWVAYVDAATGLTQRVEYPKGAIPGSHMMYDYRVIETVERDTLSDDFFTVESLRPAP